jgi:lactoylglutathione lyase
MINLRLIVIRTSDIQVLSNFYSILGLEFDYHKHGNSPYHYSTTIGKTVLEIYPLLKPQESADNSLRLGFEVENLVEVSIRLKDIHCKIISEPTQTEFGFMMIVEDFEGRKIELYQKE